MKILKRFPALSVIAFPFLSIAQQFPQYSQYQRNQFILNPAAAGIYDFTDITLGGRMQWVGFQDAPKTSYFSVAAPLQNKKMRYNPALRLGLNPLRNPEIHTGRLKHAMGAQMLIDQYGAFQHISTSGTYTLHLPLTRSCNMSLGTKVGLINNSFIESKAIVANADMDKTYQDYISGKMNLTELDLGFGMYIYTSKAFIGFSADHLTKDMVTFGRSSSNFDTRIHYTMMGGIKLNLTSKFTLTPSILVKYMNPAPPSVDITAQLEYDEWIWTALSYRNQDALVGMVGLNLSKRFKLAYSYDAGVSRLNRYNTGSHEVILGIMLR